MLASVMIKKGENNRMKDPSLQGSVFHSGMGKGQSRIFCPSPARPQTSVSVPVPRDTKSAGTGRGSRHAGQFCESRHI